MSRMERITQAKREFLLEFVMQHPPVVAAIGYGSGIIPQYGSDPKDAKEMDLILVVPDLMDWMTENLIQHPEEYTKATMNYFRKADLSKLEKGAPIVYFSHILFQDRYLKMGVISEEKFLSSCYERTSSYVPFRIEKPIVELFCKNPKIHEAVLYDRRTALLSALFMLKEEEQNFSQLMTKICSLSYMGDFRMKWHCEDPNKIRNLVEGQLPYFIEDYEMVNNGYYQKLGKDTFFTDYENMEEDLCLLPKSIQTIIASLPKGSNRNHILVQKLEDYYILEGKKEALLQAWKGVKTTGIQKSLTYGIRKAKKGLVKK